MQIFVSDLKCNVVCLQETKISDLTNGLVVETLGPNSEKILSFCRRLVQEGESSLPVQMILKLQPFLWLWAFIRFQGRSDAKRMEQHGPSLVFMGLNWRRRRSCSLMK